MSSPTPNLAKLPDPSVDYIGFANGVAQLDSAHEFRVGLERLFATPIPTEVLDNLPALDDDFGV